MIGLGHGLGRYALGWLFVSLVLLVGGFVAANETGVTVQQSAGVCWKDGKQVDCGQVGIRFSSEPTIKPLKIEIVDGSVTVTGGTDEDLRHEIIRANTELRGRRDATKALAACRAELLKAKR